MRAIRTLSITAGLVVMVAVVAAGQQPPVPRPFPTPGSAGTPAAPPRPPAPPPASPQPSTPVRSSAAAAVESGAPTEATLGLPIYPQGKFLASYDAGRGQRYYLFGSTASFESVVAWYRSTLKDKGDLVFDEPPTHMFEVGKFREETMAFPPGVTVKDYTWGGSQGYLNPNRGADPARFPTIIQVVPSPAERTR